jgi:hypothetical protein
MRARILFSFVGALIAAVALVSASGAATAKAQKVTRIDVSTRAAVIHYLRSIHVNPKGAVIQRGALNYAGARCPGGRWTCASTKHTVVQIAKRGGQNRFMCRSKHCVVVQFSGTAHGVYSSGRQLASAPTKPSNNTAFCVKTGSGATTGSGQSCTITQLAPGPNTAGVYQNTQKVSGLTQSAQYTASIKQVSSGSAENMACVTQMINLDGSTTNTNGKPTTANLQAHQSVTIKQDAAGNGTNSAEYAADTTGHCITNPGPNDLANLTQSQTLTSTVTATGKIFQNEDATFSPCGDTLLVGTDYANLCLEIDQNMGSGSINASGLNNAIFTQTSNQTAIANATKGADVSQTQSTPLCPNSNAPNCVFPGGLVGTVNQYSLGGLSTAKPTQIETQCEDAAATSAEHNPPSCDTGEADAPTGISSLTQKQYGPVGVAKFPLNHRGRQLFQHGKGLGHATQTGFSGDVYTISQTSTQDNDQGTGSTQQNLAQSDCDTSGSCTSTQTTTVNGSPTSDTQNGKKFSNSINCTGSSCPTTPNITSGPTQPSTTNPDATFTFTDGYAGATFLCQLDGTDQSGYSACSSGVQYTDLSCGPHTFNVEATDTAGDITIPASYTWTVTVCFDGSPGIGSPGTTLGGYTMTPFGTDSQSPCTNDGTTVTPAPTSSVTDTARTITFDQTLNHDRIGFNGTYAPNCWATWSNGYTGDVYDTASSTNPGQVTITLPAGTKAFYFYAEGNQFVDIYTVTATEAGGRTSGPITVNGDAGATYLGFYGIDGATLTSIKVTDTDPFGFAVGEFGINTTG